MQTGPARSFCQLTHTNMDEGQQQPTPAPTGGEGEQPAM